MFDKIKFFLKSEYKLILLWIALFFPCFSFVSTGMLNESYTMRSYEFYGMVTFFSLMLESICIAILFGLITGFMSVKKWLKTNSYVETTATIFVGICIFAFILCSAVIVLHAASQLISQNFTITPSWQQFYFILFGLTLFFSILFGIKKIKDETHEIYETVKVIYLVLIAGIVPIILFINPFQEHHDRKIISQHKEFLLGIIEKNDSEKANEIKNSVNPIEKLKEVLVDEYYNKPTIKIAENKNLPIEIMYILNRNEDVNVTTEIVSQPNCPSEILDEHAYHNFSIVRGRVAKNPNTPVHILEMFLSRNDDSLTEDVAENPNLPINRIIELSEHSDYLVRASIAKNPNTPSKILFKLVNDEKTEVIRKIAENKNSSEGILEKLSQHEDKYIRMNVASNQNTSLKVLKRLASDTEHSVKSAIASNPKTTLKILKIIKRKSDSYIIDKILLHPNINEEYCNHLLLNYYPDYKTLVQIIKSEKITTSTLSIIEKRFNSTDKLVAKNPKASKSTLNNLCYTEEMDVVMNILSRNDLIDEQIEILSKNKIVKIRAIVAKHIKTPEKILLDFADDNPKVQMALLENPNITVKILKEMARTENIEILKLVAKSKNKEVIEILLTNIDIRKNHEWIPKHIKNEYLKQLLSKKEAAKSKNTSQEKLLQLAKDENVLIRYMVSNNPITGANILDKLSKDNDDKVRIAVSLNCNTCSNTLESLTDDYNLEVQKNVAFHKNSSEKTLKKLSESHHLEIRRALAENTNISNELITKLSHDSDFETRKSIFKKHKFETNRLEKIFNADTDPEIKDLMMKKLIYRKNTSSKTLQEIAMIAVAKYDTYVASKLAKNSNMTINNLNAFAMMNSDKVNKNLILNTNISPETLDYMSYREACSNHTKIAGHPLTLPITLARIHKTQSKCMKVCKILAQNPNTPDDILKKLAKNYTVEINNLAKNTLKTKNKLALQQ